MSAISCLFWSIEKYYTENADGDLVEKPYRCPECESMLDADGRCVAQCNKRGIE
jgi:hypothetical protein